MKRFVILLVLALSTGSLAQSAPARFAVSVMALEAGSPGPFRIQLTADSARTSLVPRIEAGMAARVRSAQLRLDGSIIAELGDASRAITAADLRGSLAGLDLPALLDVLATGAATLEVVWGDEGSDATRRYSGTIEPG